GCLTNGGCGMVTQPINAGRAKQPLRRRARIRALVMSALGVSPIPALRVFADTAWNVPTVGSGNWSNPANWTNGPPQGGDNAYLIQSDAVDRIVTYDLGASPGSGLARVTLDATGPG